MKSSLDFFNEYVYYITPSDIIEFLYCKRFTYFMKCLGIRQYEENRYKVQKGREVHEEKTKRNKEYLRRKIGGIVKEIDVQLVAPKLKLKGRVDEVYELEDGSLAPLDYKYASYEEKDYKTYTTQSIMYGLMLEEIYEKPVHKGFLVYCRDGNKVKEILITDKQKQEVHKVIAEYLEVLGGYFPKATKYKARCMDCCYKNICLKK